MANQTAKYLVTGASGQLGALAIENLLKAVPAANIVALVRRPDSAAALEEKGIEVRQGDYTDPASLEKAFRGIDRLLLISSSDFSDRPGQHRNVAEAAKKAGVKFIAYTSILKADTADSSLARDHLATEKAIAAAGVPYAFLRNGWYTENYAGSVPAALQYGAVMGAAGEGRIASAARADYAEAAAKVLSADRVAEGAIYELAGDTSFTLGDLAGHIARTSGKPVVYNSLSEDEYRAALVAVGLPQAVADMLASADAAAAKGALEDNSHVLSRLIGRPTTPWTETISGFVTQQKAA